MGGGGGGGGGGERTPWLLLVHSIPSLCWLAILSKLVAKAEQREIFCVQ